MEKIKKDLKQTSEVWMISWSTTPYIASNGGRMYMLQIGGDNGCQLFGTMFETEPTSKDVITVCGRVFFCKYKCSNHDQSNV